jgi:hypothetical protein
MYYDFEIDVEDESVYIVSDVFGKIPVPSDMAEAVRQANSEFLKMVCDTHTALSSDDIEAASKIVDAMEQRWGASQTKIRSLRWQILESLVKVEDSESDEP